MISLRLAALIALAAVGCTRAPTTKAQLLVVVSSDLGQEVDEVSVTVLGPDGDVALLREFSLGSAEGQVSLPISFGVAPVGGDVTRRVTLVAEGRLRGMTRVRTRARTSFAEGRVVRLDLFLAKDCEDDYLRCESMDQTCRYDGCAMVEVPIEYLADGGGLAIFPDAAVVGDARVFVDATAPVVPDAGFAQGTPCTFADGGCPLDHTCIASKGARPLCRKPCDERGDPFACSATLGFGSTCVNYRDENDAGTLEGFYCSLACDPLTQRGCPATTACDVFPVYIEVPDVGSVLIAFSDCRGYGDAGQEGTCASGPEQGYECAPGFDCYNTNCRRLCPPTDGGQSTCESNFVCGPVDPIGPDAGRPVGVCYPN